MAKKNGYTPSAISHQPSATMDDFPKLLIALGISIALIGVVWWGASRWFGNGQLPGTFVFQAGNVSCMVPLLGSILLSVVLTIVLNLILRGLNK